MKKKEQDPGKATQTAIHLFQTGHEINFPASKTFSTDNFDEYYSLNIFSDQ